MDFHFRWRDHEGSGLEHTEVRETATGVSIEGLVIGPADTPFAITYRLETDPDWHTKGITVQVVGRERSLELRSDGEGHWWSATDAPLPLLAGCLDVDLTATPLTNTLPIRRLRLNIGDQTELRVVYIVVPELQLEVSRQRYTRLAERIYRFESLDSGFTREITVDENGFVLDYPGLFRRVDAIPGRRVQNGDGV